MSKTKTTAEVLNLKEPTAAVAIRPESLTVKRKLTLDATSIMRLKQVIAKIDGEMEVMTMPPAAKDGPEQKAVGIPITDIVANTQYLLICNSLIVSAFQRAGTPLTGRYFALRAGEIKAGKRYRLVEVLELEVAP